MATFELKENLSKSFQKELARILAIPSASRLTSEANFLLARVPYQKNRVLRYDTDAIKTPQQPNPQSSTDNILEAEGESLPTGYSGFKQGATFYLLTRTGRNLYVNVGDSTSAVWTRATDILAS